MADRPAVTAMQIANALSRTDSQQLAEYGFALLESLTEARASLAAIRAELDGRREKERVRKRKSRAVTGQDGTAVPAPVSPHTPHLPPTSPSSSSAREALLASRLPSDAGRNALTAVLTKGGDSVSVVAEIGMVLDGGRPNVSMKPEHVELALCDYAANEPRWNNALFRTYVQRASRREPGRMNRRGGVGQRSAEGALRAVRDLSEAG